ncbi:TPA: hypothetical protein HA241_00390 [Candidatus Woesearchaeota archaeon]|nr:hypothetical protein [Candidatus Woesearchaeota archaeon]
MIRYNAFFFAPLEIWVPHPTTTPEGIYGSFPRPWVNAIQNHKHQLAHLPTPDVYLVQPPPLPASEASRVLEAIARKDFSALEVRAIEYPDCRFKKEQSRFSEFVDLLSARRLRPGHLIVVARNGCVDYLAEILQSADYNVNYRYIVNPRELLYQKEKSP